MSDSPVASGCHAYPLELQKRHLLTRIDCRRWLIDTGSPTTFGHAPALCLGGRTYDVTPTGFTGLVDPHYLAEQTGCTVDGLMGSRLMSDFDILFDIPGRTIAFSEALLAVKGAESTMGTCGTLTARVNGHEATLIFDTGADISYVDPAWVAGVDPVGEATDFYPFLGSFTMPTYRVGVDLQGHGMDVLAGILPDRRAG